MARSLQDHHTLPMRKLSEDHHTLLFTQTQQFLTVFVGPTTASLPQPNQNHHTLYKNLTGPPHPPKENVFRRSPTTRSTHHTETPGTPSHPHRFFTVLFPTAVLAGPPHPSTRHTVFASPDRTTAPSHPPQWTYVGPPYVSIPTQSLQDSHTLFSRTLSSRQLHLTSMRVSAKGKLVLFEGFSHRRRGVKILTSCGLTSGMYFDALH